MPNAKKLPSGNWQVKVYSHTEYVDGKPKRIRESFTASTKAEAEYQAALFKRQNKRRLPRELTLGDALQGYIDSKDGILSPSTIRGYRQMKRTYLRALQEEPLSHLTNLKLQAALNQERKAHGLSPKTMRNIAGLLSAAIDLYMDDFRFKVTLPEKERYHYHLPTQEEISGILAITAGTEMHTAILLAACLGLRRGEICALKWSDFDWEKKVVRINKASVQTDQNSWKTKKPKSYAGDRVLSLSDGLVRELMKVKSTGHVVSATPALITNRFIRVVEAAGVEHFRFHDLRHFNASLMLAEGIPDKYAVERMGHSTTAILKSVYQHTEDEKRKEVNSAMNGRIDSLLGC